MNLESAINCPHCCTTKLETMPTEACLFLYVCTGCGARLRASEGGCCVFCSYRSVPCPPNQATQAMMAHSLVMTRSQIGKIGSAGSPKLARGIGGRRGATSSGAQWSLRRREATSQYRLTSRRHRCVLASVPSPDDTWTLPNRDFMNASAVAVIRAPAGGATAIFGSDIARVLDDGELRVLAVLGKAATDPHDFAARRRLVLRRIQVAEKSNEPVAIR